MSGAASFEFYREAIVVIANWGGLADMAERIDVDDRLTQEEKADLFNLLDTTEGRVRPTLRRESSG